MNRWTAHLEGTNLRAAYLDKLRIGGEVGKWIVFSAFLHLLTYPRWPIYQIIYKVLSWYVAKNFKKFKQVFQGFFREISTMFRQHVLNKNYLNLLARTFFAPDRGDCVSRCSFFIDLYIIFYFLDVSRFSRCSRCFLI